MWTVWLTNSLIKKGMLCTIFACVVFNMFLVLKTMFTVHEVITTKINPGQKAEFLNLLRPPKHNKEFVMTSHTTSSACPPMSIHAEANVRSYASNRTCIPHVPTEEACKYTAELFSADQSIQICNDTKFGAPYTLCEVTEKYTKKHEREFKVHCNLSSCDRQNLIRLKIMNPSDGEMLLLDIPGKTSDKTVEEYVQEGAKKTVQNGFNFLFIECTGLKFGVTISQLLTFLPEPSILLDQKITRHTKNKPNINVLLLDSISRPHFYRSLPKTVKYLHEKQSDPNYKAHIFDFELFQSVHGHTHENEHAFFAGTLFPENYTKKQKEEAPSEMQTLFKLFKNAGYQTLAQDDLCWKSGYGHMDSFKAFDWVELQDVIKVEKSHIDSTGITHSSCVMQSKLEHISPFQDSDELGHQLCYNGIHQHRYLLDYVTKYLDTIRNLPDSKPLFAFTETNVAHDDVGIRVQTLDQDLMKFMDTMAEEANTITIIYADHGNTYTQYQYEMLEGRLEMYHPILLVILPKELGNKFGKKILKNMQTNQYRLINLFDIRESVLALASYSYTPNANYAMLKQVGFFGEISKYRACDDLKLSTPNYCICENEDISAENTMAQMVLAEFAIGELNNQIQRALLANRGGRKPSDQYPLLFGACQRLRVERILAVREHQTKGKLVSTLDLKLHSGNVVNQSEVITVQVLYERQDNNVHFKLISYNRISKYGVYSTCADTGVPINLCVCRKLNGLKKANIKEHIGDKSTVRELKPCVYLVRRSYEENLNTDHFLSVNVYELANICDDYVFNILVKAELDNLISTRKLPVNVKLRPRTIYFVMVTRNEVGWEEVKLKWHFHIVRTKWRQR